MDDALGVSVGEGVVWVGAGFEGGLAGVDIVAGRRAGGGGLEAVGEAHAFLGESVDARGDRLSAVAADVEVAQVVGQDEDEVWFRRAHHRWLGIGGGGGDGGKEG